MHASVRTRDVGRASSFYRRLGYREITATRGAEVVLLRNGRGHELNLVADAGDFTPSNVSLPVEDIDKALDRLSPDASAAHVRYDAMNRRVRLSDPDGNDVELVQPLERRLEDGLFLVVTAAELRHGLSQHYFLPPAGERRFVAAPARSAFIELVASKLAPTTSDDILTVTIDSARVSMDDEWGEVSAAPVPVVRFPRVLLPVDREALTAVRVFEREGDELIWPGRSVSVDEYLGGGDDKHA